MIIEKITFEKKEYIIRFSNKQAVNIVEDTLIKFNLYKGAEVPDDFDKILFYEDQLIRSYNLSCRYLTNLKSSNEVRTYLLKKDVPVDIIEKTLDLLEEKGFLDDYNYAVLYIHDAQNLKKYGQNKIKYSLQQKGINKDVINEAMDEIDFDLEYENIKILLKNKIKEDYSYKSINKAVRFLLGRGYNYSMIKDVLNEEKDS